MGTRVEKIKDSLGNVVETEPYVIYLVRHGQPEWAREGLGIDEPRLTELGYKQAESLGQALKHLPITDFYASNLLRARETAAPLARLIGREPEIAEWYQEVRAKNLDGYPVEEVRDYFEKWYAMPLCERRNGPPEGENFAEANARLSSGIDGVLQRAGFSFEQSGNYRVWQLPKEPRCIVMVGHTFASAMTLCHLMDLDYCGGAGEQFRMGWGAYNKLVPFPMGGGFVWRLKAFNVSDHLRSLGLACDDLPEYEVF